MSWPGFYPCLSLSLRTLALLKPTGRAEVLELVEQQRDTVAASRDREKAGMDRLLDVLSGTLENLGLRSCVDGNDWKQLVVVFVRNSVFLFTILK